MFEAVAVAGGRDVMPRMHGGRAILPHLIFLFLSPVYLSLVCIV